MTGSERRYLPLGVTGAQRDTNRLTVKAEANAKVYADLPEPTPSRQVQRRAVRTAVSHQVPAAKAEAIRGRRRKMPLHGVSVS